MSGPDLSRKTGIELDQMIANHERKGVVGTPLYLLLLEERANRRTPGRHLDCDRSIAVLEQAACEQKCTTYGALADASGMDWQKARHQMDGAAGHLNRVSELCHFRGLPFLTALCVSQPDVKSGELKYKALEGFIACARRLGYLVTDASLFHRQRRDECWRWGRDKARP